MCSGPIKPGITFFGENLPEAFFEAALADGIIRPRRTTGGAGADDEDDEDVVEDDDDDERGDRTRSGTGASDSAAKRRPRRRRIEAVLVLGTSLKVQPVASIPDAVARDAWRVLINREPAGHIGARPRDVLALGELDAVADELATLLGWKDDLDRLVEASR